MMSILGRQEILFCPSYDFSILFLVYFCLAMPLRTLKIFPPVIFHHFFLHFFSLIKLFLLVFSITINSEIFFCTFYRLGVHKGLTGFAGIFLAALVAQSLSLISTGYTNFFARVWNAWNMVSKQARKGFRPISAM